MQFWHRHSMVQNRNALSAKANSHDRYTDAYIGILNVYKNYIRESIKNKFRLKSLFFALVCVIMAVMIALFFFSIYWSFGLFSDMVEAHSQPSSVITGAVTAVVSSLVTMTTSIIVLPKIVADYLFNKKEDRSMTKIIGNIQGYEIRAVETERLKSEAVGALQTGGTERVVEPAASGIPSDSQTPDTSPAPVSVDEGTDGNLE